MSWMRALGSTGLTVSALGLGTVKLGRNKGVKYPGGFTLPDDASAAALLDLAWDLGINLLDTAPAYGCSEERLGALLGGDGRDWLICSKVGEEFEGGRSHFDFSPEHCRFSIERSLSRLRVETLDIVLVHSDGNDLAIIEQYGTLQALAQLQAEGKLRSYGVSTKTVSGGLAAARAGEVVMVTYNPDHRDEEPVLAECARLGKGVLLKKLLASGHLAGDVADPVQAAMDLAFSHPGTSSAIVGTISPAHLRDNVLAARRALGEA